MQKVQRLLSHDDLAGTGSKHRQQADAFLHAIRIRIPRQPDAVGGAQLRLAVVSRELLGRECVLAVWRLALWFLGRIVVRVND